MNKQKLLTYAVVGLMLMNIALMAFLFLRKPAPPHGNHAKGSNPKQMVIKRFGFDEAQVAAHDELIKAHRSGINQLDKEIRANKNALYATLATTNTSTKDSLIQKLGNLQLEVEALHYNHFAEIKALCKPTQIDAFNEFTNEIGRLIDKKRGGGKR